MCNPVKRSERRRFVTGFSAAGLLVVAGIPPNRALAKAAPVELPRPGPYDSCPVCGMFPARYPDWIATVLFKDGHADHFDGAKDFFKYLLDMKKYAKGRKREDIADMGVTDYYATRLIRAQDALYVSGSDVLSPMGHDLVPHPDKYDAEEFLKDHRGKHILRFGDVSMQMLKNMDEGEFEDQ
jgi:nitrous oxide reductase accessory protein NosL